MADDKQKNADFIGRMVSDPKNPPETRMLTGWFGDSGEEGYRRLYTDAELSNYVDIPDDAILYTEPLRDVQPAGGVVVWIKRDAALKQGGSASSRAARFLQGQVQQDFASAGAAGSLEQAGLRCVTVVPCGEPTGFTGQCTKQPEVGGAWPCITAIPHCFEVTGFTGKCTHAPWPNPTRYIGCTQLHCPTNDLTHIPHICNIVASGNPGCVVVNPPQEGDPAQKAGAADAEAKPLPATEIPGCGYTKSWGVCETHLLGCGYTKEWGNQCPTHLPDCPTAAPGCGWSKNPICTDLPGCNWTKQPAICAQGGGGGQQQAFAARAAAPRPAPLSQVGCPASDFVACSQFGGCPTLPRGDCTFFGCPTHQVDLCPSKQLDCTMLIGCPTHQVQQCPTGQINCTMLFGCPTHQVELCPTKQLECTMVCTRPPQCLQITQPPFCPVITLGTPQCPPVSGGFQCPSALCQSIACQSIACQPGDGGEQQAFARQVKVPVTQQTLALLCTQTGPQCPQTQALGCTQFGPQCNSALCPPPSQQGFCPPVSGTFQCPSALCQSIACQSVACQPGGGGQQAFAAAFDQSTEFCPTSGGCGGVAHPQAAQVFGLPQTLATVCTQAGPQCHTQLQHICPTGGVDCTVVICTHVGPLCPPNTHPPHCPAPTPLCPTVVGPHCPPHTIQGPACPVLTTGGPQCPPASGFNCPSQPGCQSIACGQSIACQPGGGGQQEAFAARAIGGGPLQPTPATHCFVCDPQAAAAVPHTQLIIQCHPSVIDACATRLCTHQLIQCHPSLIDACPTQHFIQCNPSAVDACPTRIGCPTQNPAQCPPASGLNCPSVAGCQSIACGQSVACQPGGGGQQEFAAFGAARAAAGGGGGIGVTAWLDCTHFGWQCPPFFTQFEQQCVVQPNFTFDPQCLTPPPPTPACPTLHCPPKSHLFVVCTAFGPQCPRTVVEARAAQPAGGGIHPTIWTQLGPQCPGRGLTWVGCYTLFPFCRTTYLDCLIA